MFKELEERLNYEFENQRLLKIALTHKSSKNMFNNERLEFLGDAVMDLIIGHYLFTHFRAVKEGDLSKLRAALVNEKSFAEFARALELNKFLILSTSENNNHGREKNSILSDAFEALMGAIYLEAGLEMCQKIAISLLEQIYPNISLDTLAKDYKTALQEITQARFGLTPTYKLVYQKGPDHDKEFRIAVILGEKSYGEASGKSKKEAQQKAAQITIEMIK